MKINKDKYYKIKSLKFLYEIKGDFSEVRNIKSKKVIQPHIDRYGYKRYTFNQRSFEGGTMKPFLHQIVMEVFGSPKPEWATSIDHIDRDKLNNHISNLRWATAKMQTDNRDGSYLHEHGKKYSDNFIESNENRKVKIEMYSKKHEYIMTFDSLADAAQYLMDNGYTISTNRKYISDALSKRKYVNGFYWKKQIINECAYICLTWYKRIKTYLRISLLQRGLQCSKKSINCIYILLNFINYNIKN